MRRFIEKLRALPEGKKKIVFFGVLVGVGLILGGLFIWSALNRFSNLQLSNIGLPDVGLPESVTQDLGNVFSGQLPEENLQSSKTAAETADWNAYENAALGFSLKYPKNWKSPQYDFAARQMTIHGRLIMDAYANQQELIGDVSLDQWLRFPANTFDIESRQEVMIGAAGNIPAISIKKSFCNSAPLIANVVIIGASDTEQKPLYVFRGPTFDCGTDPNVLEAEYAEAEKTFNLILSTLIFN